MPTDVYRTLTGEVNFSQWNRESTILFADIALASIVDIELRFHTSPTLLPPNPASAFVGAQDVRLHINQNDVTPDLKTELGALITALPADHVRQFYLAGVRHYLEFIRAFGTHTQQVQNDDQVANTYANSGDWASKFNTLGDRGVGWSGNLHVLNFIYRVIPICAVSLSRVWASFVQRTHSTLPSDLKRLKDLSIMFSEGPAPSYEQIDINFIPGGKLQYQIDLKSENPLKASLTQILARLTTLQQSLEGLRSNYLQPLQGNVQTLTTEVHTGNTSLSQSLDRLKTTVENIAGP